jgi:hypothetical protein
LGRQEVGRINDGNLLAAPDWLEAQEPLEVTNLFGYDRLFSRLWRHHRQVRMRPGSDRGADITHATPLVRFRRAEEGLGQCQCRGFFAHSPRPDKKVRMRKSVMRQSVAQRSNGRLLALDVSEKHEIQNVKRNP